MGKPSLSGCCIAFIFGGGDAVMAGINLQVMGRIHLPGVGDPRFIKIYGGFLQGGASNKSSAHRCQHPPQEQRCRAWELVAGEDLAKKGSGDRRAVCLPLHTAVWVWLWNNIHTHQPCAH